MYLLIAIVVFWPLSLGVYSLQYDALDVYLPWRFYGSESLRQGLVPLWNPFQDGGYPFYADHQYSIWNPELFVVSLFTRYNALVLQYLFLLYLALGALGFRFLLKQFDLDSRVWFAGGVLFMLSGVIIGHGQSVVSILGAVWLVWALGAYFKAVKNGFRLNDILGLILFMYLMLSSGYQAVSIMLFYLVLTVAMYHVVIYWKNRDWKALKRFLLGHLLTGISLGVLLMGIVFSLLEVFPHLSRLSGLTVEDTELVRFRAKSLYSLVYPLASVQKEYSGTSVTAQNVYTGTIALFFLFYSMKTVRKRMTPIFFIFLLFAVIYGVASLGSLTPLQPWFAKTVPGFDQFYYASFYRYFTWIACLILIAFGLERFLHEGSMKLFKWFLSGVLLFYVLSAVVHFIEWEVFWQALSGPWYTTFRKLGWNAGVFIQSIFQVLILGVFLVFLLKKVSPRTVLTLMVLELALISQLNIPVTVHGESKTAVIDNYLNQFQEGFFTPSNAYTLGDYEKKHEYVPIWRNQGNFNNLPKLNSWTSFLLVGREKAKYNEQFQKTLLEKPLAYLRSQTNTVELMHFHPNLVDLRFAHPLEKKDTLVLQQACYPGWKVEVDGKERLLERTNGFQRQVIVEKGAKEVRFSFQNTLIERLYYFTMFGFLLLLFAYGFVELTQYSFATRATFFGGIYVLLVLRIATFSETPGKGYELERGSDRLRFKTALSPMDYQNVYDWLKQNESSVKLRNDHMDPDTRLLALLGYVYQNRKVEATGEAYSGYIRERSDTVHMDSLHRYGPLKKLEELFPEQPKAGSFLLFGLEIHEIEAEKDVFVVIEVKENDEIVHYKAVEIKRFIEMEKSMLYADGYLLPPLNNDQKVVIWIWNNSDKKFSFSNFRVKLLDK